MRKSSQWPWMVVAKETCCFKSKLAKISLNVDVAVDCISKWRLKSPRMKNSEWSFLVNHESQQRRMKLVQEDDRDIGSNQVNEQLEIRIDLDRMGLYFQFIGYQKANATSTSRLTWLVIKRIVIGKISDIQEVVSWGLSQVSVRPKISNCFRYYQVCETDWFIMDGTNVAGSQTYILQYRRAWIHMHATCIQVIKINTYWKINLLRR